MIGFLTAVALAGKWTGEPSDIVVERQIAAPTSSVYGALVDLEALGELMPDTCVAEWVVAPPAVGPGARVTVHYTIGLVRRRLPGVLSDLQVDRVVDLVHEGKRGFTTRWQLEAAAEGTRVKMTTFLSAPPWPVTGPYFTRIKPAWETCQADLLAALAGRVEPK